VQADAHGEQSGSRGRTSEVRVRVGEYVAQRAGFPVGMPVGPSPGHPEVEPKECPRAVVRVNACTVSSSSAAPLREASAGGRMFPSVPGVAAALFEW
jgi:hypothetical protein